MGSKAEPCLDRTQGPPFKPALRILASKFLKRTIQVGSHDSEVDARTTMDLAQLKIKHGPAYGTKQEAGLDSNCERLMEVLGEFQRRCILVDRQDVLSRHVSGGSPPPSLPPPPSAQYFSSLSPELFQTSPLLHFCNAGPAPAAPPPPPPPRRGFPASCYNTWTYSHREPAQ